MFEFLQSLLKRNSLTKRALGYTFYTGLASVFPILVFPVLTRIYDPIHFAVYEVFASIGVFLTLVVSLRLDLAILDPKEDSDAESLYRILLLFSGTSAILISIPLGISYFVFDELSTNSFFQATLLLPVYLIFAIAHQAAIYWNLRKGNYRLAGFLKVFNAVAISAFKIAVGYSSATTLSLVLGTVLGQTLSALLGILIFITVYRFQFLSDTIINLKNVLKKYRDFPFATLPQALLMQSRDVIVPVLIGMYWNPIKLGHFSALNRLMKAPTFSVGNPLSEIIYQRMLEYRNSNLNEPYRVQRIYFSVLLFCILTFGTAYWAGPPLLPIILGPKWTNLGEMFQILVPYFGFGLATVILERFAIVFKKQLTSLKIHTVIEVASLAVLVFSALSNQKLEHGLAAFVGISCLGKSIYLFWIYKISTRG